MKVTSITCLTIAFLTLACTNMKPTKESKTTESVVLDNNENELFLFVGTYTSENGSEGIYLYKINTETGVTDSISMVKADNPSYLTLSKDEKFLYAVGESGNNSSVSAFAFDKNTGVISHINTFPSGEANPCYIEIDDVGRNIFTANYSGGSISVFSLNDDGGISEENSVFIFDGDGPDKSRQESSHLHSVRFSPDGKFLFATDLGADKVYRFNSVSSGFIGQPVITKTSMVEFNTTAEMGPRHFDFHPSGKFFYLLGELSGQIAVYDYDDGMLTEKQTVVCDSLGARGSADIHVSPDGKFVYASNRLKGDGISIFSVNEETGELEKINFQPTGIHPRNFVITPDGSFLLVACRDNNKIQVFKVDKESGLLSDTNNDILVSKPVCLKFA